MVVRLTDDALQLNTPALDRSIPWPSVNKVAHNPVAWTVSVMKVGTVPLAATVLKAPFTEAERAEFDTFLARLPEVSHKGQRASGGKTSVGGR